MSKALFFFAVCFISIRAYPSGSVVGNGGDPLFYFLEVTRDVLVETLQLIHTKPAEQDRFCVRTSLTRAQTATCQKFLSEIYSQVLVLNQGVNKTQFALRADKLEVVGPDGKLQEVSARTDLGPKGEIEIHRDSVKLMAPGQVLFLLAHEFGHKALFAGRFVTDNEKLPPFANGRELIDNFAASVLEAAKRNRKVGSEFGIWDNFICLSKVGDAQVGSRVTAPRLFLGDGFEAYRSSIGANPLAPSVWIPEAPGVDLVFQMKISEETNCSEGSRSGRRTELAIIRQTRVSANSPEGKSEVLVADQIDGFNPICEKTPSDFGLRYGSTEFSCKYFGAEGRTFSAVRELSLKSHARH